eukprot:2725059-Heterocapsa_arctica.AAC.1
MLCEPLPFKPKKLFKPTQLFVFTPLCWCSESGSSKATCDPDLVVCKHRQVSPFLGMTISTE